MPEFFDIHSHLDFLDYEKDFQDVLKRMKEKKVWTITIGTDLESSKRAVKIAEENEGIFASIGMHPLDSGKQNFNEKEFENLAKNERVVAIGECGLDWSRIKNQELRIKEKERQIDLFKRHIEFSLKFNKPLMLHFRSGDFDDAYEDALEILSGYKLQVIGSKLRGNCHFFAGNLGQANKFIKLGFSLSFTGVITFTRDYDEVIKNVPIENIMSETDAPFVAPVPYRGKRNEPVYVEEVVKRIAEIRGADFGQIKSQLVQNAIKSFDIKV